MAFAGCAKLFDVQQFISTIDRLSLLPPLFILPFAILVIQSELWLGLALAFGFRTRIVSGLLAGLLALFVGVIIFSLLRGTAGNCGCFGPFDSDQLGLGVVMRDLLLLSGCLWLSLQKETHGTSPEKSTADKTVNYLPR